MATMEADAAADDSFGEEEEYQPIDYKSFKAKSRKRTVKLGHKRAQPEYAATTTTNSQGIENARPSKKQRVSRTRNIERVHYEGMDEDDNNNNSPAPAPAISMSSKSIINSMKKNKDYESRASTKIVGISSTTDDSNSNNQTKKTTTTSSAKTSIRKKRTRSNKRNTEDALSTTMLIAQKTTQSTLHAGVPLTAEEKFLQQQYKKIDKILAQQKTRSRHRATVNGQSSLLESALSADMTRGAHTSSSIIVEPGQQQSELSSTANAHASTSTVDDCFMSTFTETFVKSSTQYITQKNLSSSNKRNIDVDEYFGDRQGVDSDSNKPLTYQQRIELDQKRALHILSKTGEVSNIGENKANSSNSNSGAMAASSSTAPHPTAKTLKRTKLRKPVHTPVHAHAHAHGPQADLNTIIAGNTNETMGGGTPQVPPDASSAADTLNDADADFMHVNDNLNDDAIMAANDPATTTTTTTSMSMSMSNHTTEEHDLNSGFDDGLLHHDDTDNAADTTLNLQKFELARKAAQDTTSAFDDDDHLENRNVYVGGLHPDADNSMLRKFFQHCGDIKQIRLDWRKKGFGFVHYATHEQAREAIEDMDGRLIMGQPIKCRWAKNKQKIRERELMRAEMEKAGGTANGESETAAQAAVNANNNNDLNANMTSEMPFNGHNNLNSGVQQPPLQNFKNNSKNNSSEPVTTSSMGFLSRGGIAKRKPLQPPALIKATQLKSALHDEDDDAGDGVVDNNDSGEVEYW